MDISAAEQQKEHTQAKPLGETPAGKGEKEPILLFNRPADEELPDDLVDKDVVKPACLALSFKAEGFTMDALKDEFTAEADGSNVEIT